MKYKENNLNVNWLFDWEHLSKIFKDRFKADCVILLRWTVWSSSELTVMMSLLCRAAGHLCETEHLNQHQTGPEHNCCYCEHRRSLNTWLFNVIQWSWDFYNLILCRCWHKQSFSLSIGLKIIFETYWIRVLSVVDVSQNSEWSLQNRRRFIFFHQNWERKAANCHI